MNLVGGNSASEHDAAVEAHARHYAALAARQGPRLEGDGTPRGQLESLHYWQVEDENLQAALAHAEGSRSAELIPALLEHLHLYLQMRSEFWVALEVYQRLLPVATGLGLSRLAGICNLAIAKSQTRLGNLEAARAAAQSILDSPAVAEPDLLSQTLHFISLVHQYKGETARGLELIEQALGVAEASKLDFVLSVLYVSRGYLAHEMGQYDTARALYLRSLDIVQRTGNRWQEAACLNYLGWLKIAERDAEAAQRYYAPSLEIRRSFGDRSGEAQCLNDMGCLMRSIGDLGKSREYLKRALQLRREVGHRVGVAMCLSNLGLLNYDEDNMQACLDLNGESLALQLELNDVLGTAGVCLAIAAAWLKAGQTEKAQELFHDLMRVNATRDLRWTFEEEELLPELTQLFGEPPPVSATPDIVAVAKRVLHDLGPAALTY